MAGPKQFVITEFDCISFTCKMFLFLFGLMYEEILLVKLSPIIAQDYVCAFIFLLRLNKNRQAFLVPEKRMQISNFVTEFDKCCQKLWTTVGRTFLLSGQFLRNKQHCRSQQIFFDLLFSCLAQNTSIYGDHIRNHVHKLGLCNIKIVCH